MNVTLENCHHSVTTFVPWQMGLTDETIQGSQVQLISYDHTEEDNIQPVESKVTWVLQKNSIQKIYKRSSQEALMQETRCRYQANYGSRLGRMFNPASWT